MVEHLEAEQFYSFTRTGYSRPARVRCSRSDGSKLDAYVKFMGGVRNREFGLAAELLASLLAGAFGLSTPTPFIVNLSPEFLAGVPEEAKDLVSRSLGLNFASQSAPEGFSLVPPEPRVPVPLRSLAAEIFAFDVLVQNYDRKADNPNLLWDRTSILMIDHESAFSALLARPEPSLAALELDRFYDHVFYSALSRGDADYGRLAAGLERLSAQRLEELFGEIPTSWQVKEDLAKVRQHLLWAAEHRETICALIGERLS